jgi:hypothetical protein
MASRDLSHAPDLHPGRSFKRNRNRSSSLSSELFRRLLSNPASNQDPSPNSSRKPGPARSLHSNPVSKAARNPGSGPSQDLAESPSLAAEEISAGSHAGLSRLSPNIFCRLGKQELQSRIPTIGQRIRGLASIRITSRDFERVANPRFARIQDRQLPPETGPLFGRMARRKGSAGISRSRLLLPERTSPDRRDHRQRRTRMILCRARPPVSRLNR